MEAPKQYPVWLARTVLFLASGLVLVGCMVIGGPLPSPSPQTTALPATAVALYTTETPRLPTKYAPTPTRTPTSTPTPTLLPTPGFEPYPPPGFYAYPPPGFYLYPSPRQASPTPADRTQAAILAALQEFHSVRADAEETLNPGLLQQVCVDPYLSQKMERIGANKRDGSYWKTVASDFSLLWLEWYRYDEVRLRVRKEETKLFFPKGSRIPDDEICAGTIYSYRNCTYEVEYTMLEREGRWYVSAAESKGDCPSLCQKGLPTPLPTSTLPPTPTPQPTPTMAFPPGVEQPSRWPALPADLYFLRNGQLWRWPAGGGDLVQVRASQAYFGDPIREYRLAPGEKYVAYLTNNAYLYVLDRSSGEQIFPTGQMSSVSVHGYGFSADGSHLLYVTPSKEFYVVDLATGKSLSIPVIGHPEQFALTSDSRYLVYLSVETPSAPQSRVSGEAAPLQQLQATDVISHGTLFAVDVENVDQPYELAFCGPAEGEGVRIGCRGFLLSPSAPRLVLTDDRGVWLVKIPEGDPKLLADQSFAVGSGVCDVHIPLDWFSDGKRLLEQVLCYQGSVLAVMEVSTGIEQQLPDTGCYMGCRVEWSWGSTGLWVSTIPGKLYLVEVSSEGYLQITPSTVGTESRRLCPTELKPLPDGGVAFAHQRCATTAGAADPWPAPGIFVLEASGAVRRVASLPSFPCSQPSFLEGSLYQGSVLWTADGLVFLYLDEEATPMLLGLTDGSALWDVRELLWGASRFHWGRANP